MKHARKKQARTSSKKPSENTVLTGRQSGGSHADFDTVRPRTEADFRRKYLFDDHMDEVTREIARAGYKPRSLDSYIPSENLESKVKVKHDLSGDTARIDTAGIKAAAEEDMKHKKSTRSGRRSAKPTASSAKKGKASTKKKTGQKKRIIGRIAAALGVVFFVGAIILIGIGAGMYTAVSKELEEMNIQNLALNYSSFVYYNDADGNAHELLQLHYEGDRRVWADSEEISDNLKNAAVSIEDERFYKHNGFDIKRTIGASVRWGLAKIGIGSSSYGGSTITQQLVKNITNEKDKTALRKIKEIMRAVALEKQINDKDAILTMYLNISFFANQCYGVEAAANLYFSKHASEVSIAEAATIVGITQRPTYYDPVRNPDNALTKRNVVLSKMNELGYITDEEYAEAKDSPLGISESASASKKTVYSYFVDQVINDVKADLMEQKGYSDTFAEQQVFSGGLKIYTTMDYDIQAAMESVFESRTGFPKNTGPQAAMVIMDQYTGEVKGIVGGAGKKTDARGLNRATQSRRQPGSSLKPLAVYSPGIELGKINSATVLRDEKLTIGDWSPVNSYTGYKGDMTLRKAIEISSNITAVKALQLLGIENSYDYVTNHFGINLVNDDKSLASLGLGGLTNGATVLEMTAAYAALANKGVYTEPYTYSKVLDSTGRVLLENTPQTKQAVSESTAFIMTDLLHEVIYGSSGTGRAAKLANNMPCYGKTGTTNDNKDKWFVGFTKYYTGAVWFGFDQPSNLRSAGITNNPSCVIWKNVMDKVHQGLTAEGYTAPSSVKSVSICSKTGLLASSGCEYAEKEYFVTGNAPTRFCKLSHGSSTSAKNKDDASAKPTASPSSSSKPDDNANAASSPDSGNSNSGETNSNGGGESNYSTPAQIPNPPPDSGTDTSGADNSEVPISLD